jgi:hypothetical protein
VACRYSQIPGINFHENFAPVINDIHFRIMLITKLIWDLEASIVDLETEFVYGKLQEEIYMNIPEGITYDSKHGLLLTKTIYGLVQSVREFYKTISLLSNLLDSRKVNLIRICYQKGLKVKS